MLLSSLRVRVVGFTYLISSCLFRLYVLFYFLLFSVIWVYTPVRPCDGRMKCLRDCSVAKRGYSLNECASE